MDMMGKNILNFKKGSFYSRQDIGYICYPDTDRPKGGDWDIGDHYQGAQKDGKPEGQGVLTGKKR